VKIQDPVKPLRIVARLRNNRLIRAREALGYTNAAQAAYALGLPLDAVWAFEALKQSPVFRGARPGFEEGDWTKSALRVAKAFGTTPEYLWPEELVAVKKTKVVIELSVPKMCLEPPPTKEKALESGVIQEILASAFDDNSGGG
jgi:hypothetical protein